MSPLFFCPDNRDAWEHKAAAEKEGFGAYPEAASTKERAQRAVKERASPRATAKSQSRGYRGCNPL